MTSLSVEGNKRFRELHRRLMISSVNSQLKPTGGQQARLGDEDVAYLLSVAGRLALLPEKSDHVVAYEIVTKLVELFSDEAPGIVQAANVILARLGNFPACRYTNKHFAKTGQPEVRVRLHDFEAISREVENTVRILESDITLTDFQHELFDKRTRSSSISVSAPTSAGKSFLIALDIVRFLLKSPGTTIVIIVPTRALIRQVMRDVIEQLNSFHLPAVRVSCIPEPIPAEARKSGQVLVFTPERLTSLLNESDGKENISLLIIDEAQEVGDDSRGIILQGAIERTLARNPTAELLLACPLRSNPAYLLNLFGRQSEGLFFTEQNSPVSQNIILVAKVDNKTKLANLSLLQKDSIIPVGTVELAHKLRGNIDVLQANAALSLTHEGDSSIIYANGPRMAEDVAIAMAANLPLLEPMSPAVQGVITFVKEHVHPLHPLIKTLEHGVAFHYGHMPDLLRMGVEDLFRKGAVQYICATSTLLQGVNLPAKNVFMFRPTRKPTVPMDQGSFWNLAGRAGRMMHEYGGNVWCICPDEWDTKPYEGDRLVPLESALSKILESNSDAVMQALADKNRPSEVEKLQAAEQAFGKIFSDFKAGRQDASAPSISPEGKAALDRITAECGKLTTTLPASVFEKNSGISPYRLEELAAVFNAEQNLVRFIPLHPDTANSLNRLREIFKTLEDVFFKSGQKRYLYYAPVAYFWMKGKPLSEFILDKLKYDKVPNDPIEIASSIRTLLSELGGEVRFKYVKYLRAYYDVLAACCVKAGNPKLVESMSPLHLYIEYGAADDVLIHLMALGLSRTSAILFAKAASLPRDLKRESAEKVFEESDLSKLTLPLLVLNEIEELRRR